MTKRIGKLKLNRESVRRLTPGPRARMLAMSAIGDTVGPCRSISFCEFCVTYDAACAGQTDHCTQ